MMPHINSLSILSMASFTNFEGVEFALITNKIALHRGDKETASEYAKIGGVSISTQSKCSTAALIVLSMNGELISSIGLGGIEPEGIKYKSESLDFSKASEKWIFPCNTSDKPEVESESLTPQY